MSDWETIKGADEGWETIKPPAPRFLNPVGEGVAAFGSAALTAPLSGLAGIAGALFPGSQGQGADWVKQIQQLAYQPRTPEAQQAVSTLSYLPGKLSQAADWLGGQVTDVTGSPTLGTAARVLPDAAMTLAGGKMLTAKPTQVSPSVSDAFSAGFKLTPMQAERGLVQQMLQGLSGTAKLEKLVSIKNEAVLNKLIKDDFNIPKGEKLTPELLDNVIKNSGAAYEAVKSSVKTIKPDQQLFADAQKLRGDYTAAASTYPDLLKNDAVETLIKSISVPASPRAMVELTKKLRSDASTNLKAFDDPAKRELGMAQRGAATAVENMIDRALTSVGKTDLVKNWRNARATIAKAYDVKSALNETTGDVSAAQLARMYKRGEPLSGGTEKVARFARAFGGAAREIGAMRDATQFGYGDLLNALLAGGAGAGGAAAFGAPGTLLTGAAALAARPALRQLLVQGSVPTAKLPILGGALLGTPLMEQYDQNY